MKKNLNRWLTAALFAGPFLFTMALASCGHSAPAPKTGATLTKASLTCVDNSCGTTDLSIHDSSGGGNPKLFLLKARTTVPIAANTDITIAVYVNDSTAY